MGKKAFDRRQFLGLLAASGIAVYLPGCGSDDETTPAAGGKKVLVLGAGMAGLSAAYELKKQGYEVTVIEAQGRVGGRVHTQHDGFMNGQYIELGAVRIPDVHEHTLGYVEELGLELVEFGHGEPLYYLQGNRFMHVEGEPWPLAGMTAEEQMNGLDMWSTYVAANFEEFGNPREGTFPKMGIEALHDGKTWTEYLKSKGASDDWLVLYGSDNGSEVTKIGCLAWMAAEVADQDWDKTYHVKGGNDLIAQGLAEKVGDVILFDREVKLIEHSDVGVTIHVDHVGISEVYQADHLICAIPFSTLRNVAVSPHFPDDKAQAIDELFMMGSSRGYFQTKTRFWEAEGIGGLKIAKTDTLAERLWDLSNVQDGDTGMIVAYTQHENAIAFAAIPKDEREAYIQAEIEKFFPQLGDEKLVYAEKVWAEDPWVKGAWTDLLPGQWWMFAVIGRAEGRVHFAGEHTSIWAGWMQGAFESAKRAVKEITGV